MSQPATAERSPFRRPGWIAAAAFVVLLAVLGLIVVLHGSGGGTPNAGSGSASATAGSSASAGSGCGLSDTSQAVPTSTPAVTWTLFAGEAVPSSTASGPGRMNGAVPSCYAHTPAGALIALTQVELRLQVARDPDLAAITLADCVQNAGAAKAEAVYNSGASVGDYTASFQAAGFEFASYSPTTAVIQLAMHQNNGSYESSTYTMQWDGGDWKAQLADDGSFGTAFSGISSLTGYVPWSGVS